MGFLDGRNGECYRAGQEEPRRREASSSGIPGAGNIFSQAHGASPAMAARVGLSASALRPDLECCRQLGVMRCLTGNFEEKRKTNQREWNMRKDTGDKMHIIWLNNNLGDHDNHLHSIKIQNGAWRFTGLGIILKSVLSRIHKKTWEKDNILYPFNQSRGESVVGNVQTWVSETTHDSEPFFKMCRQPLEETQRPREWGPWIWSHKTPHSLSEKHPRSVWWQDVSVPVLYLTLPKKI